MKLQNLKPATPKKNRKRRGQGNATGNGTYGGRGMNGQNARSGGGVRLGFEGGQTPLIQRMPKMKGFNNPNRVDNQVVDVAQIEARFKEGAKVNFDSLVEHNLVHKSKGPAKILASGEITKKVTVEGVPCSAGAKAAIEKAGGTITE